MLPLLTLSLAASALSGSLNEASPTLCDSTVKQYSGYFHLSTTKPLAGKNCAARAAAPRPAS